MNNSHLSFLFRNFSKKEFRELRKWLLSPIHNQREDVVALFEYLSNEKYLHNEKYLAKEHIYQKLFPKTKYDDAKFRQTIFFLNKSVEEYLIYSDLREDEVRSKMALAGVYRKKNLSKAYQKTIRNISDLQEKQNLRNEHFLRNEYLIQKEQYVFFEKQKRNIKMNLQELSDALDTTFFADKLKHSCHMLAHQRVYKAEYKPGLLDEVLKYVEENDFLDIPALAVYYYGYQALTSQDRSYFDNLKTHIFSLGNTFPKSELRDIYLMALNYCIRRNNEGDKDFIRETFELFKKMLELDLLIENKTFSPWTFANIALNGLQLSEYEWVANFIETYQTYLPTKVRDHFVHYCMARLHFEQNDYDKAMPLLSQTDFDDILLNLNAKTLLLKMYYELVEFDTLESLLESMRTYLHRKDVGYHEPLFKNVIRLTRKLIRVNPYDKKEKEKLRLEIQNTNPLRERAWLLEQLDAM
jgi:hypothetical protein